VSFEVGETLRNARDARELTFEQIAQATRIRPQFLAALEAERFNDLPGGAYARSFLGEYAQHLGLDPRPFLEEYDERFGELRPPPAALVRVPGPSHRLRTTLVAGLGIAAVAVSLLAWRFGESHPARVATPAPAGKLAAATPTPHAAVRAARHRQTLVLAASGACWLSVHVGSRTGPLVYEGTLTAGQTLRFRQHPLWIRFGAPWNVTASLNGRPARLPRTTEPINLLFTTAVRPA